MPQALTCRMRWRTSEGSAEALHPSTAAMTSRTAWQSRMSRTRPSRKVRDRSARWLPWATRDACSSSLTWVRGAAGGAAGGGEGSGLRVRASKVQGTGLMWLGGKHCVGGQALHDSVQTKPPCLMQREGRAVQGRPSPPLPPCWRSSGCCRAMSWAGHSPPLPTCWRSSGCCRAMSRLSRRYAGAEVSELASW